MIFLMFFRPCSFPIESMVLAMEQLNEDQNKNDDSEAKEEFADSVTSTERVTNESQKRRNDDEGIFIYFELVIIFEILFKNKQLK